MLQADAADVIALSSAVDREISTVLGRAKFAAVVSVARREAFLAALRAGAVWFEPRVRVTDCRDAKDNIYLELALAAGAGGLVSSDQDLTALDPWRGVRVLRPADYLALFTGRAGR